MEITRNIICSIIVIIIIAVSWFLGEKWSKHQYGQLSVYISDIKCNSYGPYEIQVESNRINQKFWMNRNYTAEAMFTKVKKDQLVRISIENRTGVLGSMIFTVREIGNIHKIGVYDNYKLSNQCTLRINIDWKHNPFLLLSSNDQ